MTEDNIKPSILARLGEIEVSNNIKIFYACESGSRAWGFPSQDSDYDVRFLFIRPVEWYLSIDEKRDVLEIPINDQLDISGWDIKKALRLIRKTNPPLLEWLGSPIVYLEKYKVTSKLRELVKEYYSPTTCLYHYLHMARSNYCEYLQGDIVWVKKYFYVLRPILAMSWIAKGFGIVPTDFNVLVEGLRLDTKIKKAIQELRNRKLLGEELDRGPKIPEISNFINGELERWEHSEIPLNSINRQSDELDTFFQNCMKEVWNRIIF